MLCENTILSYKKIIQNKKEQTNFKPKEMIYLIKKQCLIKKLLKDY